ncbi:hypothetical protein FZEAL_5829 [Fusarium zealandicum]|uniref:Fungal N-terminal domain-containing protein n=1 Tax=Fusarium zealandicum TaxID=1053134 RepID=A0A8H4UIY7_9HYPO|nr:hypothetical protein FZEAL_5829 [Fusarium zealandicum]
MAEVVGIIAATGQFIQQGPKLYQLVTDLRDKLKDSPAELISWREDIQTLNVLVADLEKYPTLQTESVKITIVKYRATTAALVHILQSLEFSPKAPLTHRTWKAIGGLNREKEISGLFLEIERMKTSLILAINTVSMQVNKQF